MNKTMTHASRLTRGPFVSTAEQLRAGDILLVCMAREQLVEEIVLAYQKRILAENQWRIDALWVANGVQDEVILEPERTFLMAQADATIYYERCEQARKEARLSVANEGNCPLLEAQNLTREAKRLLTRVMDGIGGLRLGELWCLPPDRFDRAIDLMLRLLNPYLDPLKRFGIPLPQNGAHAMGANLPIAWEGPWSNSVDGLTQARAVVARDGEKYWAGLEVSGRDGNSEFDWLTDHVPALSIARGVATDVATDWCKKGGQD